jgi:lipopolysaccharide export LptBFGC system permease protein LptF
VWVYYLVCELFLLTALAFGLLGPRDGNRLPHRLVKGIGLALAAAVLFGVLSYVP